MLSETADLNLTYPSCGPWSAGLESRHWPDWTPLLIRLRRDWVTRIDLDPLEMGIERGGD